MSQATMSRFVVAMPRFEVAMPTCDAAMPHFRNAAAMPSYACSNWEIGSTNGRPTTFVSAPGNLPPDQPCPATQARMGVQACAGLGSSQGLGQRAVSRLLRQLEWSMLPQPPAFHQM